VRFTIIIQVVLTAISIQNLSFFPRLFPMHLLTPGITRQRTLMHTFILIPMLTVTTFTITVNQNIT
jgi:hypothetical protein